ncbi:hypothetical protein ruthe_02111 [Rubellimicrobium thermophilum DSM 16684]|uniref:Uncharacterized protein n=1 Tax=Rubellimicrobium thermophilum DSM 16684 TaxID=1123069 RepID=S9QTA6_9RHOB|nr:hypothetical protein [Rubellimicrobium thermophilum]EPX84566.1 hypothetical protein ruthe_02111 [Rubellimicrobium thermophilum DSM 16684]
MGEAGAEAILPLKAGGVRALMGGIETVLPLARAASGHLAVDLGAEVVPFAFGGVPSGLPPWAARALPSADGPASGPAAAARPIRVEVINNTAKGGETVTEERLNTSEEEVMRLIIDRVDAGLAENALRGHGQLTAALGGVFGARRRGR